MPLTLVGSVDARQRWEKSSQVRGREFIRAGASDFERCPPVLAANSVGGIGWGGDFTAPRPWDRPCRRRGQTTLSADDGPRQTRCPLRGRIPPDRFRSQQPGQRRVFTICVCSPSTSRIHSTATSRRRGGCPGFNGEYITPVPAQQRLGPRWYTGSADAIFQSLNLVYDEQPDYIVVFGADHVYRMDPEQMVEAHIDSGAGVHGCRYSRAA